MRTVASVSAVALLFCLGAATARSQALEDHVNTGPMHRVSGAEYVHKSGMSDAFEIEVSKLALQKAQDPAVRSFAQQMIEDHSQAARKLRQAAVEAKLKTAPPKRLDAQHKAKLDHLRLKSGADFDQAYMKMELLGHREALNLQKAYNQSGDNAKLKEAAKEAEPMIHHHLAEAEKLAQVRINDTNTARRHPASGPDSLGNAGVTQSAER